MNEIIFKLLGFLKDFLQNKSESKKTILEKYVEPIMTDIHLLHTSYIESFMKYAKSIESEKKKDLKNHPVFNLIIDDAIQASAIRERLFSFYDNTNKDILDEFVYAIAKYLRFLNQTSGEVNENSRRQFLRSNIWRHDIYFNIESIFFNQKIGTVAKRKEEAINLIHGNISMLQGLYRGVLDKYNQLKSELV